MTAAALLAALVGSIVTIAATPIVRSIAIRRGVVARPAADRWNRREVALMGGVGIFAGVVVAVGAIWAFADAVALPTPVEWRALLAIVAMFVVGVIDDRVNLRPTVKFACQLVTAAWLVSSGALLGLSGWFALDALITVFWFVAVTNAVNLLDNMDGVAAGVSAVASAFLGIALLQNGAVSTAVVAFAVAGACVGFLRYNFNPASIFMGDAGSLFLGATLATLVTVSPLASSQSVVASLFVPLALMAVPIVDTTLVTMTRLLEGRAVSQGGRDHTTHRLVLLGLSERQVALLLYGFAVLGGLVGLSLVGLRPLTGIAIGLVFLTTLALFAAYLARLHVEHATEARGSRDVTQVVASLMYKRRLAEMLLDVTLVTVAFYGAFWLRFDGGIPAEYAAAFETVVGPIIGIQIIVNALLGCYRGAWRYSSLHDALRIGLACVTAVVVLLTVVPTFEPLIGASRSISVIYGLLVATLMIGARTSFRVLDVLRSVLIQRGQPVIIYGAGDAGELVARELFNNKGHGLTPVCFLDDDQRKHGLRIHGVYIFGGLESAALAFDRHDCRRVVIGTRKLRPEVRQVLKSMEARGDIQLFDLDLQLRWGPAAGPTSMSEVISDHAAGGAGHFAPRDGASGTPQTDGHAPSMPPERAVRSSRAEPRSTAF